MHVASTVDAPEVIDKPVETRDPAFGNFLKKLTNTGEKEKDKAPDNYAVILYNDNSTNPEFVVKVLSQAFGVPPNRAQEIMMAVHRGRQGVVKITTKEQADRELLVAAAMIRNAEPNVDWFQRNSPHCELTFTVELESKGD